MYISWWFLPPGEFYYGHLKIIEPKLLSPMLENSQQVPQFALMFLLIRGQFSDKDSELTFEHSNCNEGF